MPQNCRFTFRRVALYCSGAQVCLHCGLRAHRRMGEGHPSSIRGKRPTSCRSAPARASRTALRGARAPTTAQVWRQVPCAIPPQAGPGVYGNHLQSCCTPFSLANSQSTRRQEASARVSCVGGRRGSKGQGSRFIVSSKATKQAALAGTARRMHGRKPA